MKCDRCGNKIIIEETPNSVHHAKEVCVGCGKWFKFIKKETNEKKRTKTSNHNISQIMSHHEKTGKKPLCFICLRTKEQLGNYETLEIDHIEELSKGGEDSIGNLQILCTACHKLKNWARLYMNWHRD